MVRIKGLEPPQLSLLDSKSSASTIPPHPQNNSQLKMLRIDFYHIESLIARESIKLNIKVWLIYLLQEQRKKITNPLWI